MISIKNSCARPSSLLTKKIKKNVKRNNPSTGINQPFRKLKDATISTLEISVSKLFPAGFCWQWASTIADGMGYGPNTVEFFSMVAVGDALGVSIGHFTYFALKKLCYSRGSSLEREFGTSVLLGSASLFSGFMWQISVNFFTNLGYNFYGVFWGTWLVCATAFFIGLKVSRALYPAIGMNVDPNNVVTTFGDLSLSVAIGGAAGMFVGTCADLPFNPYVNWLGVTPAITPLEGMLRAGQSTAVGFSAFNFLQRANIYS
jgi:hypothetical protein